MPATQTAAKSAMTPSDLKPSDTFIFRHIGPDRAEIAAMLETLGVDSLDSLIDQTVPRDIRLDKPLEIGPARGEFELLEQFAAMIESNVVKRSLIGQGYYDCIVPPVILRNILENPGWYTQYTPYQAEISQGRLEALLNFQTMVADLTGLPMANASMLDEGTAAAEAMAMCFAHARQKKRGFFIADTCHPQTINVVRTRAQSMGMTLHIGALDTIDYAAQDLCGVLVQYPDTFGTLLNHDDVVTEAHENKALVVAATDLLALTLITPPGEWADGGADIAVGSAQRFGVPMGFGGPHAAFLATKDEHTRKMPGRIVGVSKDRHDNMAYRLAIQTREQHIKRDRATSNICTSQVLLAIMAGMYATYHGPRGLKKIARRVHGLTALVATTLRSAGVKVRDGAFFDTLTIETDAAAAMKAALERGFNLRRIDGGTVGLSIDETTTLGEVNKIVEVFGISSGLKPGEGPGVEPGEGFPRVLDRFERESEFLTHPVFNTYHCEHEMLRYIKRLEARDLSLTTSMIPLGSCTMKLNGTSEMIPVTWRKIGRMHPYAPLDQAGGYQRMFSELEAWLAEITGFSAVSLQPNAGSQGEYAGLLAIRRYHESRGDHHRDVCIIPVSAHGTNPASAVIAGFKVVPVACDPHGNIDVDDLRAKAEKHKDNLGALMITYPSTHGVFEEPVREICRIIHDRGGQVYMDGANMNAQVGLTSPGAIGADVCHLNLHKTFCIPHGGGGPGMGPIGVAAHLEAFLPGDPVGDDVDDHPVSAANWGSASILPISYIYIALMGSEGLTLATQVAILSANYMAKRLEGHFDVLFTGAGGRVAHEFIVDCRPFKVSAAIEAEDIAKRLMDYGFHAPTMSWPVAGTLMIEPTESESRAELDRLCDALIAIRGEIAAIEKAEADLEDNVLKNAPHTAAAVTDDNWTHPYSRQQAAFPAPWVRGNKFWPHVGRIDNAWGDRNLMCSCPPMEELIEA